MEEAAKEVTDVRAENELKISQVLYEINFGRSDLPAEVLDRKSNPDQPYGDLELYILQSGDMILNNTQDYTGIKVGSLDRGILAIAHLTKQAFIAGYVKTAHEACRALLVTIGGIRNTLPSIPQPLLKDYLENTDHYIEQWIDYLLSCVSFDQTEKNIENEKARIDEKTKVLSNDKEMIAERIKNDPAYHQLVMEAIDKKISDPGWTPEMLDLRKQLIDQRIEESAIEFQMLLFNIDIKKLARLDGMLQNMNAKLIALPEANDPDLMNKYNTMLEEVIQEAGRADQQFDEFVNTMNAMSAKIDQLENAPGSLKMKNMLFDQAEKLVELAREKQLEEAGQQTHEQTTYGSKFQLYSEEQLQQLKSQNTQQIKQAETNRTHERIPN